jgi:tRNA (cmo5U34)-methyltransferase
VKARFNREVAHAYSQDDPLWLPEYSEALSLLIDSIGANLPQDPRFLDLGAGTGNLSRRLLERFPASHVTLMDFSENMLREARNVLSGFHGRHEVVNQDFLRASFPNSTYHAVVSSFAIHHARGVGEYSDLYRRIRQCLEPKGVFSCCDVVEGGNPHWNRINENGWKDYLSKYFSDEKIEKVFSNYRSEDSPLSLSEHLVCLTEAGFDHVDVLWKKLNFAIYCGNIA